MRTTVTKRAQTVVPAEIRARYEIKGGDLLEWIDDGKSIKVIPIPRDPVAALRGSARGEGLTAKLLESRDDDRKRVIVGLGLAMQYTRSSHDSVSCCPSLRLTVE